MKKNKNKYYIFLILIIMLFIHCTNNNKRENMKNIKIFKSFYYFENDNSTIMKINDDYSIKEIVNVRKLLGIPENDLRNRIDFYNLCVTKNENEIFISSDSNPIAFIYQYNVKGKELKKLFELNGYVNFINLSMDEKYLIFNDNDKLLFYNINKKRLDDKDKLEEDIIRKDYNGKEFIIFKDSRILYIESLDNFVRIHYLPILFESTNQILSINPGETKINSYNYLTGEKKIFLKKGRPLYLVGVLKDKYLLYYYNPLIDIGETYPLYCYDLKKNKYFDLKINYKNSGWYLIY